jgi:proteasome lid subunit RPN8/RPN11
MASSHLAATADTPVDWDSDLLKALYDLVFSTPDREVAGVLVGTRADAAAGSLPVVRAAIPATEGYVPGQAALFEHQVWAQVNATMARHYAGLDVVGWYVSRPDHGTTLTAADVANHGRWFGRRDQVLMAVDSRRYRAAIYGWSTQGLTQLSEGPIARRYTRPPRLGFPTAAVALLAVTGMAFGALAFLIAQAIGG